MIFLKTFYIEIKENYLQFKLYESFVKYSNRRRKKLITPAGKIKCTKLAEIIHNSSETNHSDDEKKTKQC